MSYRLVWLVSNIFKYSESQICTAVIQPDVFALESYIVHFYNTEGHLQHCGEIRLWVDTLTQAVKKYSVW